MEKFFSVAVEYKDGTVRTMAAQGDSQGAVFQQIKQLPGVRRVGKVSEVSAADFEAVRHGRRLAPEPQSPPPGQAGPPVKLEQLNQPLRGPRVVIDARPIGGEQPFKHLQAPPERPKPPSPVIQQPTPAAKPEPAPMPNFAQPVSRGTEVLGPAELEYRIVRSRRASGPSYLLQRGTWSERDGKRIFKLDWEKGFDDRARAEQHLEWVLQSSEELADVEGEPTENESHLTAELAGV